MELLLDDQEFGGERKSLYNFPSPHDATGTTSTVEASTQLRSPKKKSQGLITYVQRKTGHTRGLGNPVGAADSSLNDILDFGRFGIVLTRYASENDGVQSC